MDRWADVLIDNDVVGQGTPNKLPRVIPRLSEVWTLEIWRSGDLEGFRTGFGRWTTDCVDFENGLCGGYVSGVGWVGFG
jgi:hypothetical protein